jgi:Kef-type K+ transport system membrane component KefB
VFGLVEPDEVLEVFSELGVVFLLFVVGLESRLSEMRAVGSTALRVGVLGVVVPFLVGFAFGEAIGDGLETSLFIGAALMATSAGITSAVLVDLGAGDRPAARTILGAAVVDDVLALVLLSVVVGIAEGGGVSITTVGGLLLAAITVLAILSKLVGAWFGARGFERKERALISVGMVPRGEVGIIVAGIGAAAGVVDDELFAVIVGMAVATTVLAPSALRRLV